METTTNTDAATGASASIAPEETATKLERETNSNNSQIYKSELEQQTQQNDVNEYMTGFKLAIVVASMSMSGFLMLVDTIVISTAIPHITDQFKSLADIGWYASAYQFGSAAPQPLAGKIYTHFNTKWTFITFFGIFEIGSMICGVAISSNMLIVGRAIAGLGAAGVLNGVITIVSSCAPREKRPALIGLTMGLNQLGLIAGPLIGGVFTTYSTWRWCFYINLPFGAIIIIAIIFLHIPEQRPKKKAVIILPKLHDYLDLFGFALFSPAVLQLLLALQYGGNVFAWSSSQVVGLFCGSAATFVVWFFWNGSKGKNALLPISLISERIVWFGGLYQAFLLAAVYGATFFLPLYFQAINNANAMLSGVYLLPRIIPQLIMAGSSGALLMKIEYAIPWAIFATIFLTIGSGLYSLLQPGSPTGQWVGFQIIAGIGSGAGIQVPIIAIQAAITGEDLSSAMAFIIFAQTLGSSIILALCNLIFDSTLKSQISHQAPHANITAIIEAGATGFRAFVEPSDLHGVLVAYANSIDRVFYLVTATAGMGGIVLWGLGWQNLRKNINETEVESSIVNNSKIE